MADLSSLVHLRRARDLADRCFAEPLDLDDLAAAACMSRSHFARSFAETYLAIWGRSLPSTDPGKLADGSRQRASPDRRVIRSDGHDQGAPSL